MPSGPSKDRQQDSRRIHQTSMACSSRLNQMTLDFSQGRAWSLTMITTLLWRRMKRPLQRWKAISTRASSPRLTHWMRQTTGQRGADPIEVGLHKEGEAEPRHGENNLITKQELSWIARSAWYPGLHGARTKRRYLVWWLQCGASWASSLPHTKQCFRRHWSGLV